MEKILKNKLRNLTRNLRSSYEMKMANDVKLKPKLFWKYARSRLKSRQAIPTLTNKDGTKVISAKDKAESLNDFFTSVFTTENLSNIPAVKNAPAYEVLSNIEITTDLARTKSNALNPNKSPGQDKWHPNFLKEFSETIRTPLSILFTKSLKEGAHESWRKAVITAIYKKGIKSLTENYRPISITYYLVVSKLMESIVRDIIMAHMMKNNLITDNQHGFVPGHNCITQLLVCLDDRTSVMESSEEFDVIYTDFSKAFDSVAHERLLVKLQNNGIKGDLLQWIRSFFSGRTQCVNVNGILSDWKDVISGVPQGSVIGPILFVIFINDMPDEVKESVCKLFVDDCKLYRNVSSSGQNDLQKELLNLENWSTTWQLPFNATKCKVLHFGTHNTNYSYRLNNHTLDSTKNEKDL